jgi:hypothetical protein
MPLLFYGKLPGSKRRLYAPSLRPIESSVFNSFKVKHLAPLSRKKFVANYWWFEERKHTALSWFLHEEAHEHTVFIPGLHGQFEALAIARREFGVLIPSPTVFRVNNEHRPYLYE